MSYNPTARAMADHKYADQAAWLWALQLQGYTFTQMRALSKLPKVRGGLGVELSEATIHRRLTDEGERKRIAIGEMREAWQAIELERMEGIHERFLRMAERGREAGDFRVETAGLDGMMKMSHERRAFMGTNAAQSVDVTVQQIGNGDLGLDELLVMRAEDDALREAAR